MSKMTKTELWNLDFEYQGTGEGRPIWTDLDLENAMVAAYNRAVDDAANVLVFGCKDTPSEEQMSKLIKLKI